MCPQGRTNRHSLRLTEKGLWILLRMSAEYVAEKCKMRGCSLVNQGRVVLRVGQQGSGGRFFRFVSRSLISRPGF